MSCELLAGVGGDSAGSVDRLGMDENDGRG
jgi:hypothetical protein